MLAQLTQDLFGPSGPEPSYPSMPEVGETGESNVEGIYLIGDVGGTPLVKLGLNQGVEVAERIHTQLGGPQGDPDVYDIVVVGAGPAGLAACCRSTELGLANVVLESNRFAMTVQNMYKGKVLFAEPEATPNKSKLWFEECTREQLLERWEQQIAELGLPVRQFEKVEDIRKEGELFVVVSNKETYRARRVVLAIGKSGNPRKAGVPGETEHAARIQHNLSDPSEHNGKNILVYGGGDVACEAALALCDHNKVTMVTIDKELVFPKQRNREAIQHKASAGAIDLHLASSLAAIEEGAVVFKAADDTEQRIQNDVVFEMIGAELPLKFFDRIGIALEGKWHARRWMSLAFISLAVYTLYALKKFPESPYSWPFNVLFDEARFSAITAAIFEPFFSPFRWLFTDEAYASILDTAWFQQGYLYSLAYTLIMVGFGYQAFVRWRAVARNPAYQKWRYLSLIAFQITFFLIANVIAVQGLSVQHAWRAWGLYQPWPLFFNTFNWWNESDPRALLYGFVGAGLVGTFVAIPLAARWHGKRFCTWICGCGGLAETLGDRWRHLAPKGKKSRAWEFQNVVVLVAAAIVTLVTVGMFDTRADNGWAQAYSYIVDFWLVAVIPIALYPFFGGKIWCRYWCPLASWNQILAKWYGKLKIQSNDQCITCGLCGKYCQVGVDVMAFAKNQAAFDNQNSACIHCGICIDVCPMDVLGFDSEDRLELRLDAA